MSIEFKASICPNCGAKIRFAEEADRTQCQYCGVTVFVDRSESRLWIEHPGKPVDTSTYEKLAGEIIDNGFGESERGLAEKMAKHSKRVFPHSRREVREFIEWLNSRGEVEITKERHVLLGKEEYFFFFESKRLSSLLGPNMTLEEVRNLRDWKDEVGMAWRYRRECKKCGWEEPEWVAKLLKRKIDETLRETQKIFDTSNRQHKA